ncbi:unnamed protein product [Closterium sp. NIES-53]
MSYPGLLKNCLVNDTAQGGGGGRRRLAGVDGMRKLSREGVGMGKVAADAADAVRGWFGGRAMAWVRGSRRRKLQQQWTRQGSPSINRSPPLYTVQSFADSPLQTSAAHLHLLPHQLSLDVHISVNATASAVCFPRFVHVRDILRAYAPLSASVPVLAVGDLVFTAFLGLSDRTLCSPPFTASHAGTSLGDPECSQTTHLSPPPSLCSQRRPLHSLT